MKHKLAPVQGVRARAAVRRIILFCGLIIAASPAPGQVINQAIVSIETVGQ